MSDTLIAEIKRLVDKAENGLKEIKNAEPTQLRIVENRLRLFCEQHGIDTDEPEAVGADETPRATASKPRSRTPKAE